MPRIRSIHPGQWTDEDFVNCSMQARLVALAIRNEADDYGAFAWKPRTIKMRLFPNDDIDISACLDELENNNQIMRLDIGDKCYGYIRNFCRYQSPKAPRHQFPMTETAAEYVGIEFEDVPDDYRNSSETVPKHYGSDSEPLDSGIGVGVGVGVGVGERTRERSTADKSKKVAKLDDLELDDELTELARTERRDAKRELERFRDYHLAGKARRTPKNFKAAFRNWLRSDFGKPDKPPEPPPRPNDLQKSAYAKQVEEDLQRVLRAEADG